MLCAEAAEHYFLRKIKLQASSRGFPTCQRLPYLGELSRASVTERFFPETSLCEGAVEPKARLRGSFFPNHLKFVWVFRKKSLTAPGAAVLY